MKPLAVLLAALALVAGFAGPTFGQSAPPAAAVTSAPRPWRPLIIVDPRPYLASPTPRPKLKRRAAARPHASSKPRRPLGGPTPETFERLDTSPAPHSR